MSSTTEGPVFIESPITGTPDPEPATLPADDVVTVYLDDPAASIADPESVAQGIEPPEAQRLDGLDALRGVLLLMMNFAFTIPYGVYAAWMYHMQYPPPDHNFTEIAGIAWRDLTFAGFLFTMSAAIPVTMSARLAKGMARPEIAWLALRRAVLLYVFALIIGHTNPYWTQDQTKLGNVMAMIGFVLCFAVFVRPPRNWTPQIGRVIRLGGWLGVASLFALTPLIYGFDFSMARRDDIIASIAVTGLFGTVLWLLTQQKLLPRLLVMAAVVALRLSADSAGWAQNLWGATPAAWLYQSWYLELMLIVIPGIIVGDLLVEWMRTRPEPSESTWSPARLTALAVLCASFIPVAVMGYFTRATGATTAAIVTLCLTGAMLTFRPVATRERMIAQIFRWSAVLLLLGALLEPFQGGIKKEPQTLSYLLLTPGLFMALLVTLLITIDMKRVGERALRPLVQVGQNPLLAYVVYMLFISHLLWLVGAGSLISGTTPLQATITSIVLTGVVTALVWLASRHRVFWRA